MERRLYRSSSRVLNFEGKGKAVVGFTCFRILMLVCLRGSRLEPYTYSELDGKLRASRVLHWQLTGKAAVTLSLNL